MSWVTKEMSDINLGDKRLNKRTLQILESMHSDPNGSIPRVCQSWKETKAAYRYFDNPKVTQEKIMLPHKNASMKRIKQQKRVLLIQDTTYLNYSSQKEKKNVGPVYTENQKMLFFHPLLAITPEKLSLGVLDIYTWYKEEILSKKYTKQYLQTQRLHHQSISEKESYRWLLGYRKATAIAQSCPNTHITMIADREADISDIYHEAEQIQGNKSDWLIRCKISQRVILNKDNKRDEIKLKDKLLNTKPVGNYKFETPRRPGKKSRLVRQSVRVLRVKIHPPTGRRGKLRLQPFWITAVLAKEEKPPKGEKGIEWLLLTNIELNREIQFTDIIQWYICRWQIEIFFYILKSGCKVEELQLAEEARFLPCLSLYSIIAWRILMMTQVSRVQPTTSCEVIFSKKEWKSIYIMVKKEKPPIIAPELVVMVAYLAQLGGFLARKNDGFPGPKTIWLGLKKLRLLMEYLELKKNLGKETYG